MVGMWVNWGSKCDVEAVLRSSKNVTTVRVPQSRADSDLPHL